MKYIIAIDIGGSTFRTGLFSDSLTQIDLSEQDKIRYYNDKISVRDAIINQVLNIIDKNNIIKNDILGVGIALPGPLDTKKGIILNTPNLTIFQNYNIVNDFNKELDLDIFIENDANLFALGEWYSNFQKSNVLVGVTLGTGLGFGLIIDGILFKGGNGFAMEYGLSPFEWGAGEKNICIKYIKESAKALYGKEISPIKIEEYYNSNDEKAIRIYNKFGNNLGIVLSHIINMIDPNVITLGGGLSKAFNCFKSSMLTSIKKNSPTFNIENIMIVKSQLGEKSAMLGASIIVKKNKLK